MIPVQSTRFMAPRRHLCLEIFIYCLVSFLSFGCMGLYHVSPEEEDMEQAKASIHQRDYFRGKELE